MGSSDSKSYDSVKTFIAMSSSTKDLFRLAVSLRPFIKQPKGHFEMAP